MLERDDLSWAYWGTPSPIPHHTSTKTHPPSPYLLKNRTTFLFTRVKRQIESSMGLGEGQGPGHCSGGRLESESDCSWAREQKMSQPVMCLPHKHKELSLDTQHPLKMPAVVTLVFIALRRWDRRIDHSGTLVKGSYSKRRMFLMGYQTGPEPKL